MSALNPRYKDIKRVVGDTLAAHWQMFTLQGAIMIFLGCLAVAVPALATIAVDVYIGWLFLISGIVGLATMLSTKNMPAFLWSLITAALSIAVGVWLVWQPVEGVLSLTLLLTAFFIVEGAIQIVTSVAYRDAIRGSWGWLLISGIADLALAAIIIRGWPATANWALGLLVGINLITSGWAIVMAAFAGRKLAETSRTTDALASR